VYDWSDEFHKEQIEFIKSTCEKYSFTYTIVPIEAAFNADFDLKIPTTEEQKQLDEEKKSDLENHATMSEAFEEVKNNTMPIDNI